VYVASKRTAGEGKHTTAAATATTWLLQLIVFTTAVFVLLLLRQLNSKGYSRRRSTAELP